MDAKKIEILLEAMESGSLMVAAEKNGYTPSGLSHLLQRLEEELGVKLAERNNRGIALSEEGTHLLPYLRNCVNAYQDLEKEAGRLGQKKAEILQMLMLEPRLAILDETDSGLDVDAVRTVSKGIQLYKEQCRGSLLIITHSTRILESLHVDVTHVMEEGKIVRNGDASLVDTINEKGFEEFTAVN